MIPRSKQPDIDIGPKVTICKGCGKPAPVGGWCITGVKHAGNGIILTSRCYGKWQAKHFQRLWMECAAPKDGAKR